jgi:hypothetical protein
MRKKKGHSIRAGKWTLQKRYRIFCWFFEDWHHMKPPIRVIEKREVMKEIEMQLLEREG